MAAGLSSTGISHHHLPHIPWIHLRSQQQPSPWDRSTIPNLQLPATALSRRPTFLPSICMAEARTVWFSFHLGCHRSAVSLSVLNVSPLTQTVALLWGLDRTPAPVPPPAESRSSPTNTLVFSLVPLSYRVSAVFCIFISTSQVLYPLSAGVLPALLGLKLYSWCIRGDVLHILPHLCHLVLWTWYFLTWKIINHWLCLFHRHKTIQITYFFLFEFWQIGLLRNCSYQVCGNRIFQHVSLLSFKCL